MQTLQIEKQVNKSQTASVLYIPVLSIVLTVCSFICLLSVFDLPCSSAPIIILSLLIPAALSCLLNSRTGKFINMFLPILIAGYFAAAYNMIWTGYLTIANSIIVKVNQYSNFGILTYDTGSVSNASLYTIMALIPVILIFTYLMVLSIKHRLFVPVILLTLPFILAGFYFQAYIAIPAAGLIVIAWTILFSNSLSGKSVSLRATAWVLIITVLFGIFISIVIPFNQYVPLQKINRLRQSIVNGIDSLRYNYGIKKVAMDTLPNGDLKNAKTLAFTDEVVMKVKMQEPNTVYLKGYVGSVYSNNRWNNIPPAAYSGNYTGLFYWLTKKNFYPQTEISSLCGISPQIKSNSMTVNNIALESKYIYTPYEAVPTRDLSPQSVDYEKDMGIYSSGLTGTRSYSFSMYSPITSDYGIYDLNKWVKSNTAGSTKYTQYIKDEMAYRAFAYKNYLGVPAETEKTLDKYFTKKTMDSLKNKNYQSVIDFLRRYYQQKFTYSSEIKKLPANSDFIANFLKTRSGYDVHFATLSVMLLRSAGIPARYVEGYYLPHGYVDIYKDTENATLDIKDSFAHAWAEVYADGVGWIPVELTPGYYNSGKDLTKNTGKDENVSSKGKNLYNDQENALTNDSADKHQKPKKNTINPLYFEIAAALIIIIALIIAAALMLKAKRKKNIAGPDKVKASLKLFALAVKLFKYDGIRIDRHCAYESLDEISRKYDQLTGMSFERFLNLVYKSRFGPAEPDTEELAFMQSYIKSLAKQIYVTQGFGKKLILKISGMV